MAFTDAAGDRRIIEGTCPVEIVLAGTVHAGDPLMYSTGWKLAINTSTAPACLIAGETGVSGDTITAYGGPCVIELKHTAANVPTMGQLIAVSDTGIYDDAAANTQDIGYIVEIDSDNLHSRMVVHPATAELDTLGT